MARCVTAGVVGGCGTPSRSDLLSPVAVGGENPVKPGEVDPRFGDQGRQTGNEIHRFQDDVGGAVPIRGLEGIADIALGGERKPFDQRQL